MVRFPTPYPVPRLAQLITLGSVIYAPLGSRRLPTEKASTPYKVVEFLEKFPRQLKLRAGHPLYPELIIQVWEEMECGKAME